MVDRKRIGDIKAKGVYLLLTKTDRRLPALLQVTDEFVNKRDARGVYVSLNLSSGELIDKFSDARINPNKLYFISAVPKKKGEAELPNESSVTDPEALGEIIMALTAALDSGAFQFLIFDSLSTLLAYHDIKTIMRLMRAVLTLARASNVSGFIFALEEQASKDASNLLSQACDEIIRM